MAPHFEKKNTSRWEHAYHHLLWGGIAGVLARTTTAPLDRVKLILQTHSVFSGISLGPRPSTKEALRMLVRQDGITGLWKGNATNCLRVFPYNGLQFMTFDAIKRLLTSDSETSSTEVKLIAGAGAGVVATVLTQPLDVLRVRLSVDPLSARLSLWEAAKVAAAEGSLMRGTMPAVVSVAPFVSINFTVYESLKVNWEDLTGTKPHAGVHLLLGAISIVVAQTVCYPLDTVRRRMQMRQALELYRNSFDCAKKMIRTEGALSLYAGMVSNILKVAPTNAIRFAVFEFLRELQR